MNYIDDNYIVNGFLNDNKVSYTISEDNKIVLTEEETTGEVVGSIIYDYKDYDKLSFNTDNYIFNKLFDIKWQESKKAHREFEKRKHQLSKRCD